MGNVNKAPSGGKPLILPSSYAAGLYKATFTTRSDCEVVTLATSSKPDAYYLPWKNNNYTEGQFSLGPKTTVYFFTADMSGCSLWYRLSQNTLFLRHEARTDADSQRVHSTAGFTLLFDTNTANVVALEADEETRTAVYFVIYALVDYEHQRIEFRIQQVRNRKNFTTKAETFTLENLTAKTVLFIYV